MSYNKGKENKCPRKSNNSDGTNHPVWYTKTAMIEQLVGANFFKKKAPMFTDFANVNPDWLQMPNMSLMTILTIPQDSTNSFHADITQLYKNIRRSNSGAANYTVSDLERYVLNVRSLRAALASLIRIRRAFNTIDPLNQAVPFDLVNTVVGGGATDPSTWLESLAVVDSQLSKMGALMETALPCGDLTIFDRTDWLFGNVFVDTKGPKQSYIACVTEQFPLYSSDGTSVTYSGRIERPGNNVSLQQACLNLWTAFAAFNGEYKNALIAGDIMHAFGDRSFKRTLHWGDVNKPLDLVYDESVLTQIMNATVPYRYGANMANASISNGVTTQELSYTSSYATAKAMSFDYSGTYINGYTWGLDGGALLTATRFCWHGTNNDNKIQVITCGSELIADIRFMYCQADGVKAMYKAVSALIADTFSSVQSTAVAALKRIASYWSKVDWAPMILLYIDDEVLPIWDVNNLAFVDWATMDSYHSAATTSLFWASMSQ